MRTEKKTQKQPCKTKNPLSTAEYKNSELALIGIGKASKRKSSWSLSVKEKREIIASVKLWEFVRREIIIRYSNYAESTVDSDSFIL